MELLTVLQTETIVLLSHANYKDHTKSSKLAHLFQRALREAVFLQVKIMFHWVGGGEKTSSRC